MKIKRKYFIIGIVGSLIIVLTELMNAIIMQRVTDFVIRKDMSQLLSILPIVILFFLFITIGSFMKTIGINKYIKESMFQYKSNIFYRFLNGLTVRNESSNSGSFLSLLTNDVNEIEQNYYSTTFDLVICIALFISSTLIMFYYNVFLSICIVCGSLVIIFIS